MNNKQYAYDNFMEEMTDKLADMEVWTAQAIEEYNYYLKNCIPGKESGDFLKKCRRSVRTLQTMRNGAKLALTCFVKDTKIENLRGGEKIL